MDSSTDSDTQHDAGHESSTRAGAVHAQPSKQASGSSHWEGQHDDKSRKQQRTDGQQTASSSSREVVSKTGRSNATQQLSKDCCICKSNSDALHFCKVKSH